MSAATLAGVALIASPWVLAAICAYRAGHLKALAKGILIGGGLGLCIVAGVYLLAKG